MKGRAAPTLLKIAVQHCLDRQRRECAGRLNSYTKTFFSLYFTTRYKRNTAARNDNWGIVRGGCVRIKIQP